MEPALFEMAEDYLTLKYSSGLATRIPGLKSQGRFFFLLALKKNLGNEKGIYRETPGTHNTVS